MVRWVLPAERWAPLTVYTWVLIHEFVIIVSMSSHITRDITRKILKIVKKLHIMIFQSSYTFYSIYKFNSRAKLSYIVVVQNTYNDSTYVIVVVLFHVFPDVSRSPWQVGSTKTEFGGTAKSKSYLHCFCRAGQIRIEDADPTAEITRNYTGVKFERDSDSQKQVDISKKRAFLIICEVNCRCY